MDEVARLRPTSKSPRRTSEPKSKQTSQKYEAKGHGVVTLRILRSRKKHAYICKKCLACDDQKTLIGKCIGGHLITKNGCISPGPAWWKQCRKANGKAKIEETCEINKDTTQRITEEIKKYESKASIRATYWRANIKKRNPGKANTIFFKKICEKAEKDATQRRRATFRTKVIKAAQKRGHEPIIIYKNNLKKNIYVCKNCLVGNKQERWSRKCQKEIKPVRGVIPPGVQWWRDQRKAIGKEELDRLCGIEAQVSKKITQQIRDSRQE
jgi:hypothetical protein